MMCQAITFNCLNFGVRIKSLDSLINYLSKCMESRVELVKGY